MIEWTPSARKELERYVSNARGSLEHSGADPAEVAEDLRRHIDEEMAAARLKAVTEDGVRRILHRMGVPEAEIGVHAKPVERPSKGNGSVHSHGLIAARPSAWLLIFGALLPLVTLVIELTTRMCAGTFFDPLPTPLHLLLAAFVPIANILVWWVARSPVPKLQRELATPTHWLNGIALGVTLFYAVLFLPLVPQAVIAIIAMGWGLLPLSPLFATISAARLTVHTRSLVRERHWRRNFWRAFAAGFFLITAAHFQILWTQTAMRMAAAEDPEIVRTGLERLRQLSHTPTMLRACYGRPGWASEADWLARLAAGEHSISPQRAREVYYRVTGRPFNSTPPPVVFTARGPWTALQEQFTWDAEQGGPAVAGTVRGLSMASSRQDAVIDAEAALAYVEWTIEFANSSAGQREARAQVALPRGGVVSRLTLWVNGEEREAAFGGRSHVREAYQQIVEQRRDPVLITTCGPDRVLVQCFPVPPDGTMKIRFGITCPLVLTAPDEGYFSWPTIIERNFQIADTMSHSLWAQSRSRIASVGSMLKPQHGASTEFVLHGSVPERDFIASAAPVRVARTGLARAVWLDDRRGNQRICQRITESRREKPERIILVIDGSVGMDPFLAKVADVVTSMPENVEIGAIFAGDDLAQFPPSTDPTALGDWIRSRTCGGGQDNIPALNAAWDLAAEKPDSALIWVHGPQPVLLDDSASLRQRFERSSISPRLYEIQTAPGPNRVVESLDGISALQSIARLGSVEDDIRRLFARWIDDRRELQIIREVVDRDLEPNGTAVLAFHVARLWARDEVLRLIPARRIEEALRLCNVYQLVTPISGAVVLETAEQFARAGLSPVAPQTVPVVPEPGTWAILGLGLLFLFRRIRNRS